MRAADELARFYKDALDRCRSLLPEQQREAAPRKSRSSHDASLKSLADAAAPPPADPETEALNEYQLRHALATLQVHAIELYLQLNESLDQLDAKGIDPPVDLSPQKLLAEVKAFRARSNKQRSDVLERYLHPPLPPPSPEAFVMGQLKADAGRQDELEGGGPGALSPEDTVAEVMAGRRMRTGPPAPSTIAPLDARTGNSLPITQISPRTFPMPADVPGTLAFRADPAGNPADAIPSRENVMRLMSAAGISQQMAEEVASGRMTIEEARRGKDSGEPVSQVTLLSASDPRWQVFYYGPTSGRNNWRETRDDFYFSAGGGTYLRSDRRVNSDFDSRVNGEVDRRVNSNHDRRIDAQVDTRVNY